MRLPLLSFTVLLALPAPTRAEDPAPNSPARIQFEMNKAKAEVDKKYEGKSERDLTREERLEKARAENEATNAVLEAHGTDAKSFSRMRSKMAEDNPEGAKSGAADQEFAKQVQDLKDKEEKAKAKKPDEQSAVVVEKGIPVTVENGVTVEHGIDKNTTNEAAAPPPEVSGPSAESTPAP